MVKAKPKFFFTSIHKPPASTEFAITIHELAATVEPFLFSSRWAGWLMNGAKIHFRLISRTLYDIWKSSLNSCVLSTEEGAHGKIKRHQKRCQKETGQIAEGKTQRKTGEKKGLMG